MLVSHSRHSSLTFLEYVSAATSTMAISTFVPDPFISRPGHRKECIWTLNSFTSNSQLVYASQTIAISHPGHTDKRSATRGPLIERGLRALLTPIKQVLRVIVALHLVRSLAKLY